MTRVQVGLVGFGPFAQGIARQLVEIPGAELAGVYNRGKERRQLAAEQGFVTYDKLDDLLASHVDAVIIATANIAHADQCIQSAKAGKHVFCEKPLTLTLDDYDRVVQACDKAGVITHIDYTLRRAEPTRTLIEICRSGQLGRLLTLWVRRVRGYGLWSAGKRHSAVESPNVSGGWNLHHNCHGMDLLLRMAGQQVTEVYARNVKSAGDTPCEEITEGILTFENGAVGMLSDSASTLRHYDYGAIGDNGSVLARNGVVTVKMENGKENSRTVGDEKGSGSLLDFIEACRGEGSANIPFTTGRHCHEVLLAMNRSSDKGQAIRLPRDA